MTTRTSDISAMTGEEMVALSKRHTLFEWSAQATFDPIPVARAKGIYFWTPEGKRYIDFNSQLMCVNIGHADPRVVQAIQEQAAVLPYISPFLTTETRARLGAKLAEITPGDIDTFFFTTGGADSNEAAVKIARLFTGRHKILARYRSYHGASAGAISLTGDPRRWASEPSIPGIVHVPHPYHGVNREADSGEHALAVLEEIIELEGPKTIAGFILEPITGTNGVLSPPAGYLEGVRDLCTRHGIMMICDEVMSGFGRTGAWFAVDHWKVVPDILTMAKGLTSAYVPLGAVGVRPPIAKYFQDHVLWTGQTYSTHPLACAAALATIRVYEEDRLLENAQRMGALMKTHMERLQGRHPSVGAARSIGLFGMFELVRDRRTREPLAPFGGVSPEMTELGRFFRQEGLYTLVRWNTFFTNPPLCITEQELGDAFAIIDRGLEITDKAVG